MTTIIEDLQEEVEYWRDRCELAEEALRGADWDRAVFPLALQTTRIMRLLAQRDLTCQEMVKGLLANYPDTSLRNVRVRMTHLRELLPGHLMPCHGGYGRPYTVKDRPALQAFLATGELPQDERSAA